MSRRVKVGECPPNARLLQVGSAGIAGGPTTTPVAPMTGSGGRVRHARGATNPPRGLTAEALAGVDHDQIRLMIIALLTESGITVSGLSPRGDHDELVLTIAPGWRPREGRARVFYRKVLKRDLTELATLGAQTALSEAILFEISGGAPGGFSVPEGVQFVPTAELIGRLEDAAAIKWDDAEPKVDRHLLARLKEVDKAPAWVDAARDPGHPGSRAQQDASLVAVSRHSARRAVRAACLPDANPGLPFRWNRPRRDGADEARTRRNP